MPLSRPAARLELIDAVVANCRPSDANLPVFCSRLLLLAHSYHCCSSVTPGAVHLAVYTLLRTQLLEAAKRYRSAPRRPSARTVPTPPPRRRKTPWRRTRPAKI